MSASLEGPLELAMTHYGDARGAYQRPSEVRGTANRMYAWRDAPEVCQSCLSTDAVSLVTRMALCARCKDQREQQMAEGWAEFARAVPTTIGHQPRGPMFQGYSIVFNQPSVDLGGFIEVIAPEAATRMMKEQTDLLGLWNHNTDMPMGRTSAGNMSAQKDQRGVFMQLAPLATDTGRLEKVEQHIVKGQSFGFRMIQDEWNFDGKIPVRTVTDMRVSELSVVVFPAYPQTTAEATRSEAGETGNRVAWLARWQRNRLAR